MNNTALRPSLDGQHFDVIVIGGGINGVAIARECAREGRQTLILEQRDFASGTTSRSTRIIHGGLRYLEHAEISLVRESLRERERLLTERPHLVHPLTFVLAFPGSGARSRRSALQIRMGLWLYERLSAQGRLRPPSPDLTALQRALDAGHRWTLFQYDDAQCEFPERLVAEWLVEAQNAGAVVRNHTQALAVTTNNGHVHGVTLRDRFSGNEYRVGAKWVINATGPWADFLCRDSGIQTSQPMLAGVRGSHIVVPRFPGAPEAAIYSEAVDGRPVFVVPWNQQLLVGTTEVPDSNDPSRTEPSSAEVEYLVGSFNHLFPASAISFADIRCAFAGVRPLPFAPGKKPAAVTRRHILHDHAGEGAAGMISVVGGKLTTAASLARECARKIGLRVGEPEHALIAAPPADGVESAFSQWAAQVARIAGISPASARALAEWHGRRAMCVARLAASDAFMRAPLCEHTEHIVAEAVEALRFESAFTLGDVLLRRVPVALGPCWSEECSRYAATAIGAAVGWSYEQRGEELEAFEAERRAFLKRPDPPLTLDREELHARPSEGAA